MELLLMIDAAKRASARHITAVIPYFGWARQDRKDKARVPIGAKLVAKLLETAGATRIMTMDLHGDQIQGFFEKPVDHLFASTIFLPYVKSLGLENLTIASPRYGRFQRAYAYSKYLESEVVICYKQRKSSQHHRHYGVDWRGERKKRDFGRRHDRHRRHVGESRRFNDRKRSIERKSHLHTPYFIGGSLRENREFEIGRINRDRFHSVEERIKKNKSGELCTSFCRSNAHGTPQQFH